MNGKHFAEPTSNLRDLFLKLENPKYKEITTSGKDIEVLLGPAGMQKISLMGWHPVFSEALHFEGKDRGAFGITGAWYRGDHLSVPMWSEYGSVGVLNIGFHKGTTHVELVTFPHGSADVIRNIRDLLMEKETR